MIAGAQQAPVGTAAPRVFRMDIVAQPLPDALKSFANQTGLEVAFRTEEVNSAVLCHPVVGQFTPEAALKILLGRSNLQAFRINDRLIAIRLVNTNPAEPR